MLFIFYGKSSLEDSVQRQKTR